MSLVIVGPTIALFIIVTALAGVRYSQKLAIALSSLIAAALFAIWYFLYFAK